MRGVDRRTQATAQLSNSRRHRGRAAIVSRGVMAAVFLLGAVSIAFAAEGKLRFFSLTFASCCWSAAVSAN